jgi:A/G-specific adenine glycosylase
MWEFPNRMVEGNPARRLANALKIGYGIKIQKKEALGIVNHAYSHFSVEVHLYFCELITMSKNENLQWIKVSELEKYPMGRIDRQIARQVGKKDHGIS